VFYPGDLVLIKSPNPTRDLNNELWEESFPVILSIPMAVRMAGLDSWIHHSRVKGWNFSANITDPELEPTSFSCDPLDGLKLLFKKTMPVDTAKSPS
jgi:hypothetical protein